MPPDIKSVWAGGSVTLALLWIFWIATYILFQNESFGHAPIGYFVLSIGTSLFVGQMVGIYVLHRAMNTKSKL